MIDRIKRLVRYVRYGLPVVKNIKSELHIHYLQPNGRLQGKKILLTGGSRGIGYAMAKKFIEEGAEVIISGRDENKLKETAKTLNCKYMPYDLMKIDGIDSFIQNAEDLLNGIDVLVNNAGVSLHEKDYSDVTQTTFDTQINTNLKAPFFLAQAFIKNLIDKQRKGCVLFISSETGETVDIRPYGWTKSIINSYVQGLAYRLRTNNIRVNAICPGVTATEMTGYDEKGNLYVNGTNERIYLPNEMAEIATFLISDASILLNGQILVCNEGKTINARWR